MQLIPTRDAVIKVCSILTRAVVIRMFKELTLKK
jgi:hypothetical protein